MSSWVVRGLPCCRFWEGGTYLAGAAAFTGLVGSGSSFSCFYKRLLCLRYRTYTVYLDTNVPRLPGLVNDDVLLLFILVLRIVVKAHVLHGGIDLLRHLGGVDPLGVLVVLALDEGLVGQFLLAALLFLAVPLLLERRQFRL